LYDLIRGGLVENEPKQTNTSTLLAASPRAFIMYPLEPEEDFLCLPLELDGIFAEETFGDRLRLFYAQFPSSTKALLDEVLFREVEADGVAIGLEIACPNPIIYKRLIQKRQKIGNEIRWIWPETIRQFTIGMCAPQGEGRVFRLEDYWIK
jgi:hypothetical protein